MFQDLLILITIVFCLVTLVYIAKRDDLSALAYLTLFVYTIFAQIGYVHYPQLSAAINVYYGESLFYPYWAFMLLSFAACFLGFWIFHRSVGSQWILVKDVSRFPARAVFRVIVIALLTYLSWNSLRYAADMHYGIRGASEVEFGYALFMYFLRVFGLVIVILYDACWQRSGRSFDIVLLIPSVILYLGVMLVTGARSDILYLGIAIAVYHLNPLAQTIRRQFKMVALFVLLSMLLIYALSVLEYVRGRFNPITLDAYATYFVQPDAVFDPSGRNLAETILAKDYYAPSHLLFTAMARDLFDPIQVLRSDLANSLAGLHVDYLSLTLTHLMIGTDDHLGGYAFHLFVEGFVAASWLGWVYNGIVWNLGMLLCRSVTRTTDCSLNRVLTAMIALLVPNLMRWQASGFIRALWSEFLPAFILAMLAAAKIPTRKPHKGRERLHHARVGFHGQLTNEPM